MIIEEELAKVASESWEHTVMSEVRDYIEVHGADTFKDALMTFNKDTYNKLFHPPSHITETCYLTSRHE